MYANSLLRVFILLLILACFQFQPIGRSLAFSSSCYVFGKVIDANTGLPVANATMLINAKGITPDETLEKDKAFIFMNEKGDEIAFSWPLPAWTGVGDGVSLCKIHPEIADWSVYIERICVKDRPDPYVILAKDKRIFPYKPCSRCNRDHPHFGVFEGGEQHL